MGSCGKSELIEFQFSAPIPMKPFAFVSLAAALLAWAPSLFAEVREFHDAKGRAIKADLVKARGPNIVIRNAESKEVTVPLKSFSRDDIAYICRWITADPAALDYRFEAKETEKTLDKASIPGTERTTSASGYGTADDSEHAYEVYLSNRCANPVEGVRACYRVFLLDCVEVTSGSTYASVMAKPKMLFKCGNVELPSLNYNASFKFTTRSHTLHRIKAANTSTGVGERDRLRGVWVRFYRHGVQVGEWKSGTVPRCEWPENDADKEALAADKEAQKPLLAALTNPAAEPVKPAVKKPTPAPKPVEKPTAPAKEDTPEELKIFDMDDVKDDKPALPLPLPLPGKGTGK
jgi:hypothetical protein